jgi:hypothetical protein
MKFRMMRRRNRRRDSRRDARHTKVTKGTFTAEAEVRENVLTKKTGETAEENLIKLIICTKELLF